MDARIKSGHDECVCVYTAILVFKDIARHCERSEAIHGAKEKNGLLRFARNDDKIQLHVPPA